MHTFRKYISNRGSALFMVISTMTALMITCMAMYFTVLASRSTIYAVFNQKQSYQSSMSIFDFLYNDLGTSPENTLRDKMFKMSVNEEFTASGSEEHLGDYTVTITKIKDAEGGAKGGVYDIIVSSTIDGVTETVHSQINLQTAPATDGGNNPSLSIAPTFAATGYVSNDVYLNQGTFYSDMTFDSEITHFGAYGNSPELHIYGDVNCSGSVIFEKGYQWNARSAGARPITVAIRNTFTTSENDDMDFMEGDTFMIGGDAYIGDKLGNAVVYINGDLHLTNGNYTATTYLVNGDIYTNVNNLDNSSTIFCNGNIYNLDGSPRTVNGIKTWDEVVGTKARNQTILSRDEMITQLDKRTQTNTYYKWTIDDSPTSSDDKAVKDVNLDESIGNYQTLTVGNQPLYIVHADAYTSSNNPYGDDTQLDNQWRKGCVIKDINVQSNGPFFIIIDTGDDPDNVYTIRVRGNSDGPKGTNKYFTWNGGTNKRPIILVKGNGSVVIDVPSDVIYQDVDKGVICHYNWWILAGGTFDTTPGGQSDNVFPGQNDDFKSKNVVHMTCGKNCSAGCNNSVTTTTSTEQCDRATHPAGVDRTKVTAKCSIHGIEVTYCPYCEEVMVKDMFGYWNFCKDHVDKAKVKSQLQGKNLVNKDTNGEVISPNCNIYLISSDESSEFRFGRNPYGDMLDRNVMIGYVYAPYQTFMCENKDAGNFLRFMGGMTVSDYNFLSKGSFIMCQPDKNPAELMGDDALKHKYEVSKDWKLEFVTH